jgi:Tfp pilus assembly protein PilV
MAAIQTGVLRLVQRAAAAIKGRAPRTDGPPRERIVIAGARHVRSCLSSQQGSLLIEVMVGALVLGITTLAVLSGLEGAQDTGATNKVRSEYSALAQQDIERLRSKPIATLSNYSETRSVRVGTVDYTVTSEAEWVNDASGVVSCTDDNAQAEYMKVSSTVTSPADTQARPTREATLLTPAPGAFSPTAGTAAVLLTDRDGTPLPGVSVALGGPGSFSDTTNALGCAIFGFIPSGTYSAQVTGGVTWASQLPATAPVTVNPGRTSLTAIEVEQPASLRAHFKTSSGENTQWSRIAVAHAKLPAGFLNFPDDTATAQVSSIDAVNLFPHHDGYGVYAGSCELNNPAAWDTDYFQPGVAGYVELDPGDNLTSVDVLMPTLRMSVTKTTAASRRVRLTATQIDGPECTEKLVDFTVPPSLSGLVEFSLSLPFGRYRLCVDDGVNRKTSSSFALDDRTPSHRDLTPGNSLGLDQTDAVNMTDSTGRQGGTCP